LKIQQQNISHQQIEIITLAQEKEKSSEKK